MATSPTKSSSVEHGDVAAAPEKRGRWDLAIDLLLPATTMLRSALTINEAVFRSHTFRTAPRDFVLWTALDEVTKTAMVLMRLDGLLDDETADVAEVTPIHRASLAMLIEEARLRARRLVELLVQLVLFGQANAEDYYRHFLLLEELRAATRRNEDLDEFHGAKSAWVQSHIDRLRLETVAVEQTLDFHHAWYVKGPTPSKPDKRTPTSARERIQRALPLMIDFERMAMGTTYDEAFGRPSASVHYAAGVDPSGERADTKRVIAEGTRLAFIALCIVRRCHQILGRPTGDCVDRIVQSLESNAEASRLFSLLNIRQRLGVGDFVLARGLLGEVVDEVASRYGYRSLRVDFLVERPLPDLAGDWFPARDVILLFPRDHLAEGVARYVGNDVAARAVSDIRDGVRAAWEAGLREEVRARSLR
jgi:hypothetical protein